MADVIDRAEGERTSTLERQLDYRKPVPKISHNGRCHTCDKPVEEPKLFCNGDCADNYEE